jgi:hypothetical protein
MSTQSEIQLAAALIVRAIKEEGVNPQHHREVMTKHRKEWPTLWRAIDRLLAAYD